MNQSLTLIRGVLARPLTRIILSLLILGLLFTQLPFQDTLSTLRRLSLLSWLLAVFVFLLGHLLGTLKWRFLINVGEPRTPYTVVLRSYCAGLFANLFLPSIAGGDVVRAGMAIYHNRRGKEAIILGSLLDRLIDISVLGVFVVASAFLSSTHLSSGDRQLLTWLWGSIVLAAAGGTVLLVIPLPALTPKTVRLFRHRLQTVVRLLLHNPMRAVGALLIAVFMQGIFVLLNAYLARNVGVDLPLQVWFLAWPLAKLSATLPISLGGLGVRETALALILGRFAVTSASAVGIGLIWEAVLIPGGLIAGLIYMLLRRQPIRKSEFALASSTFQENA